VAAIVPAVVGRRRHTSSIGLPVIAPGGPASGSIAVHHNKVVISSGGVGSRGNGGDRSQIITSETASKAQKPATASAPTATRWSYDVPSSAMTPTTGLSALRFEVARTTDGGVFSRLLGGGQSQACAQSQIVRPTIASGSVDLCLMRNVDLTKRCPARRHRGFGSDESPNLSSLLAWR